MYTLIGADGKPMLSETPGTLGGHRKNKIYGRLDCAGAAPLDRERALREAAGVLRGRGDGDRRGLPAVRGLHAGGVQGVEGRRQPAGIVTTCWVMPPSMM